METARDLTLKGQVENLRKDISKLKEHQETRDYTGYSRLEMMNKISHLKTALDEKQEEIDKLRMEILYMIRDKESK